VVSDDGREIWLTHYREDGTAAAVTLAPTHAIALAGRLIAAASRRLSSRTG
jgi:hypothetical protein